MFTGSAFVATAPSGLRPVGGGDFNGDGRLDYVFFNPSTRQTTIWYLNGTTTREQRVWADAARGMGTDRRGRFQPRWFADYLLFNASTRRTAIWHLSKYYFCEQCFWSHHTGRLGHSRAVASHDYEPGSSCVSAPRWGLDAQALSKSLGRGRPGLLIGAEFPALKQLT